MVLQFDLKDLPQNADIESATLSLFIYDGFLDQKWFNNGPKDIYAIEEEWSASDITWATSPSYDEEPLFSNTATTLWGWETFDITDDIQKIANGEKENNGWFIGHTTTSYGAFYRSSEYGEIEFRPKLEINYSGGTTSIQKVDETPVLEVDKEYAVDVLNLKGQLIRTYQSVRFDAVQNALTAGIYILQITSEKSQFVQKMVSIP